MESIKALAFVGLEAVISNWGLTAFTTWGYFRDNAAPNFTAPM